MAGGTLVIRFIGDLTQFSKSTAKLAAGLTSTGASLTKGLTLPILGAGVAAGKSAMDFESAMAQVQVASGATDAQIQRFTDTILTEGPKWGKPPQELADALYFVTSSGFAGAEALEILKASAQGSSAGLGETTVIADLLTSAINAYGSENLNAAAATDILAKAVQLGKLESNEFAGVMGRVMPVASAMGIEFNETAAAMSAMSMSGTDAAEGATQLRSILSAFLKPTREAEEQLSAMGLSSAGLRKQLGQKGLLPVLELLTKRFDGNTAATAKVFGNVRALTGVMNMMGANVGQTRSIFDQMTNSTGALDEALAVTSQTTEAKWNRAVNEMKAGLVLVGIELLPMIASGVTAVAGYLRSGAAAWRSFDDGTKAVILSALGVAAAIGPVLLILGKVAAIASVVTGHMALVAGGVVVLAAVLAVLAAKSETFRGVFAKLIAPFTSGSFMAALTSTGAALVKFWNSVRPALESVAKQIADKVGPAVAGVANVIATQLLPAFQRILPIVAPVARFLIRILGSALIGILTGAATALKGFVQVIAGVFNLISSLIHGDFKGAWKALKQIVTGAVKAVFGVIKVWLNVGILALFKQLGKGIVKRWKSLWSGVKSIGSKGLNKLQGLLSAGIKWIANLFVRGAKLWFNVFVKGQLRIIRYLATLPAKAVSALRRLVPNLLAKGREALSGMLRGAQDRAGQLLSWVGALPRKLLDQLSGIAGVLKSAGQNAVRGIYAGFISMGDWLYGNLVSWVKKVLPGPVEKALGISSPSKVFAKLGEFAGMGLAMGLTGTGKQVAKAATRLAGLAVVTPPVDGNGVPFGGPRKPGDPPVPGGVSGGRPVEVHQHFPTSSDPEAAAKASADRLVSALGK